MDREFREQVIELSFFALDSDNKMSDGTGENT